MHRYGYGSRRTGLELGLRQPVAHRHADCGCPVCLPPAQLRNAVLMRQEAWSGTGAGAKFAASKSGPKMSNPRATH